MFSRRTPSQNKENLIGITPDEMGFFLKKLNGGTLSNGDVLLISYKTQGSGWHKIEVPFQENTAGKGMFITTGSRPVEIIVALRALVDAARSGDDVPVTVHRTIRRNSEESSRILSHSTLKKLASDETYTSNPFYDRRDDSDTDLLNYYLYRWHTPGVLDTPVHPSHRYEPDPYSIPSTDPVAAPAEPDLSTVRFPDSRPGSGDDISGGSSIELPSDRSPFEVDPNLDTSGGTSVPLETNAENADVSGGSSIGSEILGSFGTPTDESDQSREELAEAQESNADKSEDGGKDSEDASPFASEQSGFGDKESEVTSFGDKEDDSPFSGDDKDGFGSNNDSTTDSADSSVDTSSNEPSAYPS